MWGRIVNYSDMKGVDYLKAHSVIYMQPTRHTSTKHKSTKYETEIMYTNIPFCPYNTGKLRPRTGHEGPEVE